MNRSRLIKYIETNAKEIRRLHSRIQETFKEKERHPEKTNEWEIACAEFHDRFDNLAFPGGYNGALKRILSGDSETIEGALCFVEIRPYFIRSGYMFTALLSKLKNANLNPKQRDRLEAILKKEMTEKKRDKAKKA